MQITANRFKSNHAPSNIDRYSLDHGEDAYLALEKPVHDRIVICP